VERLNHGLCKGYVWADFSGMYNQTLPDRFKRIREFNDAKARKAKGSKNAPLVSVSLSGSGDLKSPVSTFITPCLHSVDKKNRKTLCL